MARRKVVFKTLDQLEGAALVDRAQMEHERREFTKGLPQYGNYEIQRLLREDKVPDRDALICEALARLMQ